MNDNTVTDGNACLDKGWCLTHMDYVKNTEVILEGTTDLVRFETLKGVAILFYETIASFENDQAKAM